jgi:hypothetical protein
LEAPHLTDGGNLSLGAIDIKHLMQILPFALHGDVISLPPVTTTPASRLIQRLNFNKPALEKYRGALPRGTTKIFLAFVALAWSQKHLCAKTRQSGSVERDEAYLALLAQAVRDGREAILANWPELCNIPNFWTAWHYAHSVDLFGIPAVLDLCMEESMHNLYKNQVAIFVFKLMLSSVYFTCCLTCFFPCRARFIWTTLVALVRFRRPVAVMCTWT